VGGVTFSVSLETFLGAGVRKRLATENTENTERQRLVGPAASVFSVVRLLGRLAVPFALAREEKRGAAEVAATPPVRYGASFDQITVPEAANMPPTPWLIEIFAPGTWAGAMPRSCRMLSCMAYMPYMPECM